MNAPNTTFLVDSSRNSIEYQNHSLNESSSINSSPFLRDVVNVPIQKLTSLPIELPKYRTALAAGLDLPAALDVPKTLEPFERVLIPTGFAIALPQGFEAQVRPRSGLALHKGLTVLNAPGTIDADYRGEIQVLLINLSRESVTIVPGERIAQLVIARHAYAQLQLVTELDNTERGTKGYGSTGHL